MHWVTCAPGGPPVAELLPPVTPGGPAPGGPAAPARVLVIDDAHLVSDPRSQAALDYLMHHAADTALVLIARRDPPLAWHSLVLETRVTRIGAAELALDRQETSHLLAGYGIEPERADVDALLRLTQGWAAPVRIAATELDGGGDVRAAAAALLDPTAEAGAFLDTLIAPQQAPVRRFLVRTSVPERFSTGLAGRLAGEAAPEILDRLLRENFPLAPVYRDGALWFGYHPLVRAHLLGAAERAGVGAECHRITAAWHLAAGAPAAALPHVLGENGQRGLPAFLGDPALRMILQGAGRALFDGLELAHGVEADDPAVWALRAVDAVERADTAHALTYLDLACRRTGNGTAVPSGQLVALILAATLATALAMATGLDDVQLPDVVPASGSPGVDAYTAVQSGTARAVRGDSAGGVDDLYRGVALARVAADPRLLLRAESRLAAVLGWSGRLTAGAERAAAAAATAADAGLRGALGEADAAAAYIAFLRGTEPPPATGPGGRPPRPADPAAEPDRRVRAVLDGLAGTGDEADRHRRAEALRHHVTALLHTAALPERTTTELLLPHVVRMLVDAGTPRTARLLLGHARAELGDRPGLVLARAVLAAGLHRPDLARALLDPLRRDPAATAPQHAVLVQLLEANAHAALGIPGKARAALVRALELAGPERIVRPFLETPGILGLLDDHAGTFAEHNGFAAALRAHPGAERTAAPLLTETERTVLAQLPSGRTARQIADALGVSVNTVKTHLRRIYAKFGTSSRAGTLQHARRAGLL
ncbi:LuxR C-terminal-related transcriptional regulator [Nocardia asteroides]|uniref:LuxR C-terminal-related transcriptional regulator n=1 Tax=Nocardia asteroides TaxID=1824 RepID=UPI001E5C4850|nr:LuxR C-terminal-related transcriptional regulator [Nocardia asteroides]UGT61860.1 LuxR C-terminal-related transcriptional regulator [Nocardia asteroides]